MRLLFATGNSFKFSLMKDRLKELSDIELVNPKMLNIQLEILEDGKTAEENSIKKAKAYYDVAKIPTIAEDSGLFIDKFSDDEQPGLFVKRVNGLENLSNEEVLNYYINKINEYGGESLANYFTGVCIVDADGNIYSNILNEKKFLLTTKNITKTKIDGGILGCISYDLEAKKFFNDRNEEDVKKHYQELDEKYREMVKQFVLKK